MQSVPQMRLRLQKEMIGIDPDAKGCDWVDEYGGDEKTKDKGGGMSGDRGRADEGKEKRKIRRT